MNIAGAVRPNTEGSPLIEYRPDWPDHTQLPSSSDEFIAMETKRADQEYRRAEDERRRADAYVERIRKLEEKLLSLGQSIEPL